MVSVAILSGGLATRLYPVTKTVPKSLIDINGRPFISYQLELLRKNGINDVVLCVCKFGDVIECNIGNGTSDLSIRYSYDGEKSLGTGGALKKALYMLSDDFIMLYGDSYLDVDYEKIIDKYHKEKKPILTTVYHNKNEVDESNITFKDGKILRYDKKNPTQDMEYIDYGIMIMNKKVFNNYNGSFDLSDVLTDYVNKGKVSSIESKVPFYEIGTFDGIERFKKFIGGL